MTITLNALQKQRRDTASNWTSNNTVLLAGEWGIESDTKKFKIGDGTTAWQSLDYVPIPDTNRLLTGNLTVGGNFTVNGTSTTIDTTTLTVEDKNIEIGKVSTPSDTTADGGGITLKGATDKTINWVDSTDSWTLSEHLDLASGKVLKVAGTQILSATTLGSSVVSSSLTSVGTIATGTWNATAISGSKVTPDFGSQNIVTTGTLGLGSTPATGYQLQVTGQSGYDDIVRLTAVGTNIGPRINLTPTGTGVGRLNATSNSLQLQTGGNTALTIDSSGRVGIGTESPSNILHTKTSGGEGARLQGTATSSFLRFTDASDNSTGFIGQDGVFTIANQSDTAMRFLTHNTERMQINSSGRLLIGASSSNNVGAFGGAALQVEGLTASTSAFSIIRHSADTVGSSILMGKTRGTSDGATTIVQDNDVVARIIAFGGDGTDTASSLGAIQFDVDGTPGSNDMPGRIVFSTTNNGVSDYTEKMRIDSSGRVMIATTAVGRSGAQNLTIGSGSGDQGMTIRSGSSDEGNIYFSDGSSGGTEESRGILRFDHSTDSMQFFTANSSNFSAERMRIDSSGNVKINDGDLIIGTAGHGIDFSATSDATGKTSELLDDYEEGTFAPFFVGNTTGGSYGYASRDGKYTKVGQVVHFQFDLTLNAINGAGAGSLVINNLPFTSAAQPYSGACVAFYTGWNAVTPSGGLVNINNTQIYLYKNQQASNNLNAAPADLTSSARIIMFGSYIAA